MMYLRILVPCVLLFCHFFQRTFGHGCPTKVKFAIGTFTESTSSATFEGEGIIFAKFKNGFANVTSVLPKALVADNPTYIALSKRGLYFCSSLSPDGKVSFIKPPFKTEPIKLVSVTMPDQQPTHVSVIRRGAMELLLVANVNGGTVKSFQNTQHGLVERGSFTVPESLASKLRNPSLSNRFRAPHPHMIFPYKDGAIVPDLGSDYVFYFSIDQNGAISEKQRLQVSPGDGPRHAISHSSGVVYVVNELSSTLAVLKSDSNGNLFREIQINILQIPFSPDATAAAIRLTEDEKFLYVSVRPDSREVKRTGVIVGFKLDARGNILHKIGGWSSLGVHPRDFNIVENVSAFGQCKSYLVVANRDSNNVVFLERDRETGLLLQSNLTLFVTSPASVLILPY